MRFSRIYLSTHARILDATKSTRPHDRASALAARRLTRESEDSRCSIGDGLSPVYCLRINSRLVSFYTHIIGWLLLSLPPSCLRINTLLFALSPYFGTLTAVLILFFSK